jgi:hypothetical protein
MTISQAELDNMEGKAPAAADPRDVALAALQGQVAALTAQIGQFDKAQTALVTQAAAPQRPNLATEPDWANMPDPVNEPEKYQAEVARRVAGAEDNKRALERWDQDNAKTMAERVNTLKGNFRKTVPGYSEVKDTVLEMYAQRAVANAVKGGKDGLKYMFATPDALFADVTALLKEDGFPEKAPVSAKPDEPEIRTMGIPGGMEAGGKVSGSEGAKAKPDDNMFKGMMDWQAKYGYYQ